MSDITFLNASGTSQSAGAIATAGGLLTPYYTQERFVSVAIPQTGAGLGVGLSTPYAAGDAIGTKIEFPNVRKPDGSVAFWEVRILASATATSTATVILEA